MMHSAILYATPLTSIAMSLWSICVTIPSSGPKSPPHQNRMFSIHLNHIQISILHRLRCHFAAQQTSPVPLSPFVIYLDPRMAVISRAWCDAENGLKHFELGWMWNGEEEGGFQDGDEASRDNGRSAGLRGGYCAGSSIEVR
jgi:hypothetical protein